MKRGNFLAFVILALATSVYAAEDRDLLNVQLPSAPVGLTKLNRKNPKEDAAVRPQIQIGISSWVPKNLVIESFIPASPFDSSTFPESSFLFVFPISKSPILGGDVYGKAGLRFQSMSRSGILGAGGISSLLTENLYWLGTVAGANWYPLALQNRYFMPYAGVALVPSLLFSGRSAFSDGITIPALPAQFEIGTDISFFSSPKSAGLPVLNLALSTMEGSVRDSSLHRLSLSGGLRFSL